MYDDDEQETQEASPHRRSLPTHLLWRSVLGSPAAWSGSSSRGIYLMDPTQNKNNGSKSMIQNIVTDRRMFHLPMSLRDVMVCNLVPASATAKNSKRTKRRRMHTQSSDSTPIQLLSHPRIVGAATSSGARSSNIFNSSASSRLFSGNGISCMDLDRGNDSSLTGSPPRYLLVGSGGGDSSIALYDLSYFGSDSYLYQQKSSSASHIHSQSLHNKPSNQAPVTHRPIARSLRQGNNSHTDELASGGVPSGHRQPLLGVHWYPGDVYGAFVSASISGEILVWDAQNFVPVFATYTHIYTGAAGMGMGVEENKSVAPLQCMDLPKTPEGCPHGNALLALGLGADGRGVIQLCDAFRGGSATHELIGHGSSGGGVNAVAWDPHHPFRLASGGDDFTVRLWDIRKAGAAACLGVLDREKGMLNGGGANDDWMVPPTKRHKVSQSTNKIHGVESHGGPVTALAFAPGGDDLVSAGLDGGLFHWDLRPDSCYVSSLAAISGSKRCTESMVGGMDPSIATGGRLVPTSFSSGTGKQSSSISKQNYQSRRNKTSITIIQPGTRSTATLISTANNRKSSKGEITGYSLFGRRGKEPGGNPDFVLNGHLADVTCLVPIMGMWDNLKVGKYDDMGNNTVKFLTGGKDGMVLSWGTSRHYHNVSGKEIDCDDRHIEYRKWNTQVHTRSRQAPVEPSIEDVDDW